MNIQELHNRLIKRAGARADALRGMMKEILKDPKSAQTLIQSNASLLKQLPILQAVKKDETLKSQLGDLFDRFDNKLKHNQKNLGLGGEGIKNVPGILAIKPIDPLNAPIRGFNNKQLKTIADFINKYNK